MNELANPGTSVLDFLKQQPVATTKYSTADVLQVAGTSTSWLPRLQLCTGNSKLVKLKKIPTDHYGVILTKDKVVDLGETVDVYPLGWRPKAMLFPDSGPVAFYNGQSSEFKDVMVKAEVPNSSAMWGIEFLVWVPPVKRFCGLFFGTKSSRLKINEVMDRLDQRRPITLASQTAQNDKYIWQVPTVSDCSTPIIDLFTQEQYEAEVKRFANPPEKAADGDPDKEEEEGGRAR